MNEKQEVLDRAIDVAAAAATVTWFGLTLGEWESLVNILAGATAIFATGTAAVYHIARYRKLKTESPPDREAP